MPASDLFQVYLHDGPGFKVVQYGLKETIGFSKLVHLSTTYEVADAPGADADEDRDDIRIRLFVNGKIVKPKVSTNGFIVGNDAWLTDIDLKKFLNDVPLTIGSSFGESELTSGVYDEFLVFDRALSPDDAAKLFVELTGATADQIAKRQQQAKRQSTAKPTIKTVLPIGLQTGATTRVTISGSLLKDAGVLVGRGLGTVTIVESAGNKLVADISLQTDVTPGFYPIRVHASAGISQPVVVAVDRVDESLAREATQEKPAELPLAFSGLISGTQQPQIWFQGSKGDRIVADVESRRLGSSLEPVVEIKNERGTPLAIEWRKHELHGDTRAETILPADGKYFVELHDLAYRAPANSPFRIRVGDLKVVDRFIPTVSGKQPVLAAAGTGLSAGRKFKAKGSRGSFKLTSGDSVDGPFPPLDVANVEVMESEKTPELDATFVKDRQQHVVAVNGTISAANEIDTFTLKVTEQTKLFFTLKSRSVGSPLDGVLRVFDGKKRLAAKDTGGTGQDVSVAVTVPKGSKQLRVTVSDFTKSGGPTHGYRLLIHRANRVHFEVKSLTGLVEVPENGSAVLRLSVVRKGGGFSYTGPIRLSVDGDRGLRITPEELPAESSNRDVFVVLTRTRVSSASVTPISILAESTEGEPVRQTVQIPTTNPVLANENRSLIAAGTTQPVTAAINLAAAPPILYRGAEAQIPIQLTSVTAQTLGTVRFKLMSSERPRDKKPLIRLLPNQFVADGQTNLDLRVSIPFDQVDQLVDFVIVGEVVENPFSPIASSQLYSAPVSLLVRNAVQVAVATESLNLKLGDDTAITGTVTRQLDFDGTVRLTIVGLPKGFNATPVTVPSGETEFSIPLTIPKDAKPAAIPKVQLVVQSATGSTIHANIPLALKVVK